MTEEQIERAVELKTNSADNMLMSGKWTQKEYDFHMRALNKWADDKYKKMAR